MPYYRCYKTADEKFMAIGCLEPQFFKLMLDTLGLDKDSYGHQHDVTKHADQHKILEKTFASKTRDEWASVFDGLDACVTPVLDYEEATSHPQNVARGGLKKHGALTHPRTVPVFSSRKTEPDFKIPNMGADTESILIEAGFSPERLSRLLENKVVFSED
jgi:alpha-methylacyl-CoA racemase